MPRSRPIPAPVTRAYWHYAYASTSAGIRAGGDPNYENEAGEILLHRTIYRAIRRDIHPGAVGWLKLLLAAGADPNNTDYHGIAPVFHTIDYVLHAGVLLLLLLAGADPNTRLGRWTPADCARHRQHRPQLRAAAGKMLDFLHAAAARSGRLNPCEWGFKTLADGNNQRYLWFKVQRETEGDRTYYVVTYHDYDHDSKDSVGRYEAHCEFCASRDASLDHRVNNTDTEYHHANT